MLVKTWLLIACSTGFYAIISVATATIIVHTLTLSVSAATVIVNKLTLSATTATVMFNTLTLNVAYATVIDQNVTIVILSRNFTLAVDTVFLSA